MDNKPNKLALIDGSGFIFRAFHALPSLTKSDGVEINAVYGFTKMVMSLINELSIEYIAVIFDAARETFRNDIYKEYKANRPPAPPELIHQFSIIREAVKALNIVCVEKQGFEADDIIATYVKLAKEQNIEVVIISSDKDLMQLVEDPNVYMLDTVKKKYIKEKNVVEKFGVKPKQLIYAQALIGDSIDNVPGIKGLGPKTAASLISQFNSLEGIYNNIDSVTKQSVKEKLIDGKNNAMLSLQLVTLNEDVPLEIPITDLKVKTVDPIKLYEFFQEQEFKSLAINIAKKYNIDIKNINKNNIPLNNFNKKDSLNSSNNIISKPFVYKIINNLENLKECCLKLKKSINLYISFYEGVVALLNDDNCVYLILYKINNNGKLLFDDPSIEESTTELTMFDIKNNIENLFQDKAINKISYDIKKLLYFFNNLGINSLESFDDIALMSYVINGPISDNTGINKLINKLLICDLKDIESDQVDTIKDINLKGIFQEVIGVKLLFDILKTKIVFDKVKHIYEQIDKPLIKVLYEIEKNGILISTNVLYKLGESISNNLLKLEENIFKLSGETFNIGSPKQIGEILFNKLGIAGKKNKTGSWKTDITYLEQLEIQGIEIASLIINWRQLTKLKNTYIDSLPKHINSETGRIHTKLLQCSTNTGRLSSIDPNLQNIPIKSELGKQIRSAFIAKVGYKIISLDYSQIELRILADIANIDSLIKAFNSNQDIHNITASEIFNLDIDKVNDEFRRKAKTINFGIIYGISEFGLARRLQLSREDSKKYIDTYFKRYPEILTYMELAKEEARKNNYVLTKFGRKCHIDGINNKNYALRSFAERVAINAKLQGTAADIIRLAMIKCRDFLSESNVDAKLVLQIHDELLIEAKENIANEVAEKIKILMEKICKMKVQLSVNYSIGDNWLIAH